MQYSKRDSGILPGYVSAAVQKRGALWDYYVENVFHAIYLKPAVDLSTTTCHAIYCLYSLQAVFSRAYLS